MLYAFFWVIPQCLNFMCGRFGTLCFIFITGWYLPMKMEQSVPTCQHIKFRRREITQKKAYKIIIATLLSQEESFKGVNIYYA